MSDTSMQATEVLAYKGIPIVTQEMKTDLRNEGRARAISDVKTMVEEIKSEVDWTLQEICDVDQLQSRLDSMLEGDK